MFFILVCFGSLGFMFFWGGVWGGGCVGVAGLACGHGGGACRGGDSAYIVCKCRGLLDHIGSLWVKWLRGSWCIWLHGIRDILLEIKMDGCNKKQNFLINNSYLQNFINNIFY